MFVQDVCSLSKSSPEILQLWEETSFLLHHLKKYCIFFSYILLRNSGKDLVRLKVLQTEIRMHTLVSKPAAYKRETELCFS